MVDQVKILLFDEPLANLDPAAGKQAIELIDEIQHKTDTTVLIIEHRLEDVLWRNVDRIILVNEGTILADLRPDELLWLAAANTDPRRDVECRDGVLCADARSKRPCIAGNPSRFPNVVTSLPEVVRKVDERWAEYGLGERLESPSDRYRALLLSDKAAW